MALVWDQPRPPLHRQIGSTMLSPMADLENRYNYYKYIYDKRKAKIKYKYLSTRDLTLVVDTPMPVSELEWALKNVKSTLSSWGKLYSKIVYNHERLRTQQYVWVSSDGEYTLENIRNRGGICVDQSYYCVVSARAFGIPSLSLSGAGRDGFHCWFSFMKKVGKWEFDAGRYKGAKYTTGKSHSSQTNRLITDHLVEYLYDKKFNYSTYKTAKDYISIAMILSDIKTTEETALIYAQYARKIAPLRIEPWEIEEEYLESKNKLGKLLILLKKKEVAFAKYADFMIDIYNKQIETLEKQGNSMQAEALLAKVKMKMKMKYKRDDLLQDSYLDEFRSLMKNNKGEEGRKLLEKVLGKQKKERIKVLETIRYYMQLIKVDKTQTLSGCKFLSDYIRKRMIIKNGSVHGNKYFVQYLYKIYEMQKDEKAMIKLKKQFPQILNKITFK